ncbi:MAG: hypothetical protein IJK26_05280, partial [Clostridia bacterium]|nr:hypothetical protein [Clostridia bacterium]
MAVKLDVLVNYLFDNSKLKANIASLNKQMIAAWSPFTGQTNKSLFSAQRLNLREEFSRLNVSAKQFNSLMAGTLRAIREMNREGVFAPLLKGTGRRKLTKNEMISMASSTVSGQITELQAQQEQEEEIAEQKRKRDEALADKMYDLHSQQMLEIDKKLEELQREEFERKEREDKALAKANEDEINQKSKRDAELAALKEKQQIEYWQTRYKVEKKIAEEQKREDEKKKKNLFNLMLGRWGKFGLWGIAVAKGIQYISKAMNYAYQTSMQGLDWRRTIEGGAAGGVSFGQGVAAYQRAGIGAGAYQGFRRGIQGYLGQVKLGMGNAAPLMYLGLSAIDNLDETEKQLESALRRLPKDVSLALAGQMGLNYEMWEAIYSGRLDRERSMYSEQAIQQWAELAKGFNEILTEVKTLFFNYFAPYAAAFGEFLQKLSEGKTGISSAIDVGTGFVSKV